MVNEGEQENGHPLNVEKQNLKGIEWAAWVEGGVGVT